MLLQGNNVGEDKRIQIVDPVQDSSTKFYPHWRLALKTPSAYSCDTQTEPLGGLTFVEQVTVSIHDVIMESES
jgi:hypothetical protein